MAPFSAALLKEKAINAKNASSEKFHSVRDKYASRASAESSYDHRAPSTKAPPPRQTLHETLQTAIPPSIPQRNPGPPPPIRRSTRPTGAPTSRALNYNAVEFKWSSITPEDKHVFFSWLDDFFDAKGRSQESSNQPRGSVVGKRSEPGTDNMAEKPSHSAHHELGSAAQSLSQFFSSGTLWEMPWYSSQEPTPPPLLITNDAIRTHSIQWRGDTRTLSGGVLFSDLSACWYTVTWTGQHAHDTTRAHRSAVFAPRPSALSIEELHVAHQTYGDAVAAFAEGYEGTGRWCSRGECWDLANEALKAFEQRDSVPKPLPSIGTTHGHLIYEGSAWGRNTRTEQQGRWRGGDGRIRRGDIVQWKSVNIVDGNRWFTLGEPDHTAIIVRDQQPLKTPSHDESLCPADIGCIEVVEQSVHSPPARQVYNLHGMIAGELWIYRPVGLEAYLKFTFQATSPKGLKFIA